MGRSSGRKNGALVKRSPGRVGGRVPTVRRCTAERREGGRPGQRWPLLSEEDGGACRNGRPHPEKPLSTKGSTFHKTEGIPARSGAVRRRPFLVSAPGHAAWRGPACGNVPRRFESSHLSSTAKKGRRGHALTRREPFRSRPKPLRRAADDGSRRQGRSREALSQPLRRCSSPRQSHRQRRWCPPK